MLGPKLVFKTMNTIRLIRDRLKAASDQQKSYADLKKKDIKYLVGDQVLLKVSLWKKVLRFRCKGKLKPEVYRTLLYSKMSWTCRLSTRVAT